MGEELSNKGENSNQVLARGLRRLINKDYYLVKYTKEPFQKTYDLLCDEYGIKTEYFHVALLLIFTHIDLLGRFLAGEISNKNTQTNAIKFIREYLGRVNKQYEEIGGLLYHALRNGLVHLATPKRIRLSNGEYLDFSFTTKHKIEPHLSLTKRKEREISGDVTITRVLIHVSQLYEDLVLAIDMFADDIWHDQSISDKFKESFELRRVEDTEEKLVKKGLGPDFEYVHNHMKNGV
jgi:hypothetical protein